MALFKIRRRQIVGLRPKPNFPKGHCHTPTFWTTLCTKTANAGDPPSTQRDRKRLSKRETPRFARSLIKTLDDWRERFLEKIYRLADPRKPVIAQKLNSYLVVWSSMICSRVGSNADLYSWIGNFLKTEMSDSWRCKNEGLEGSFGKRQSHFE